MRDMPATLPTFYDIRINNAIMNGLVPEWEEMPLGFIIGYADVVDFVEESDSDWASTGEGAKWKWVIENARLFKEPIPYKGKQGLFDVPEIDENNLPETISFPELRREGKTLYIPVADNVFQQLESSDTFPVYLTDSNLPLFLYDERGKLENIKTEKVIFINSLSKESKEFQIMDYYFETEYYDNSEDPIVFEGPDGEEYVLSSMYIGYR